MKSSFQKYAESYFYNILIKVVKTLAINKEPVSFILYESRLLAHFPLLRKVTGFNDESIVHLIDRTSHVAPLASRITAYESFESSSKYVSSLITGRCKTINT